MKAFFVKELGAAFLFIFCLGTKCYLDCRDSKYVFFIGYLVVFSFIALMFYVFD